MKVKRSHHKKTPKRSHHKKIMKVIAPIKEPMLFIPEDFPELREPIVILPSSIPQEEVATILKESNWFVKAWKWII